MIRVYIAEDHAVVRRGLKHMLEETGDFEVVGEAANGRDVLNTKDDLVWDVLILDLSLPYVNGPEVLRRVKADYPERPVVILSMFPEDQYGARLLRSGAAAYISKDRSPEEVVQAIRDVMLGRAVAPEISEGALTTAADDQPHRTLSSREHQIFMLVVMGHPVSDIAAELDLHVSTVSNHLTRIKSKLNAKSVADVVHYAHRVGLYT